MAPGKCLAACTRQAYATAQAMPRVRHSQRRMITQPCLEGVRANATLTTTLRPVLLSCRHRAHFPGQAAAAAAPGLGRQQAHRQPGCFCSSHPFAVSRCWPRRQATRPNRPQEDAAAGNKASQCHHRGSGWFGYLRLSIPSTSSRRCSCQPRTSRRSSRTTCRRVTAQWFRHDHSAGAYA